MTKILTGFIWDGRSGGIDAYLMSFARVASEEGVRLDFLTNEYSSDFAQELADMGHGLHEVATLHDRVSQRATIEALHRSNHYDAAYFNVSTALMYPVAKDARRAGIPQVIVHAHAAGNDQVSQAKRVLYDVLNALCRPLVRTAATMRVACSRKAGRWLFGRRAVDSGEVRIVPNPVDVQSCAFDPAVRERMRADLCLEGKLVVGSVTAMKEIKNPFFLIDVFERFLAMHKEAVLVVVGGGELTDDVEAYARETLPKGTFRFLGKRSDVASLLQAFDAFVLPSRKEGLSIATLEAQAAGLPSVVSEGVPEEAVVVPCLARRLRVVAGAQMWADTLTALQEYVAKDGRFSRAWDVEAAGYSLESPREILHMVQSSICELN